MFIEYRKPRHSSNPSYRDKPKYDRLCKACGYPFGKHYGSSDNICPDGLKWKVIPSDFPKEFYIEELNKNIKVI